DFARRLGELNEQKEDFENAIAWYQYAADLTSSNDPGLVRKVSDLQRKRSEREIAAHTEFLATHGPEEEGYGERSEALADATKKEIVYNLGLVYEQMGNGEKSVSAMKQIYEADYGFRDVAARVERSYERKSEDR